MQFIEYIQNGTGNTTSNGYEIPLGYYPTKDTKVRIKFNYSQSGEGSLFFGTTERRNYFWRFFTYNNTAMYFDFPSDSNRYNVPYTFGTDAIFELGNRYIKNETTSAIATGTTVDSFSGLYPFTCWTTGGVKTNTKIYWIEIYEGNTLMMDLRPGINSNNEVGLFDVKNGGVFYGNIGGDDLVAGPALSSISTNPISKTVKAYGETFTIAVSTENSWVANPADGSWYTISPTGGTGDATVTITVPSYSGASARTDTIDFIDTNTTDEATFTLKQKKYQSGQPVYLGGDEVSEIYLGNTALTEAYLGTDLVYSSGPFVGLKMTPKSISFNPSNLTSSLKVKASEAWTLTLPSWIAASTLTGGTGETIVTLTATTQTAETADTIVVTSANYSAQTSVDFRMAEYVSYIYQANSSSYAQASRIDTDVPHTASTMTVEIEYYGLGGNSDRMVGYQQNDPGCSSDDHDFRVFGYQSGNLDYMATRRQTSRGITTGYNHLTIGDYFCYDNDAETYLVNGTTVGAVPSPNCHIYVDVSLIKVKSIVIKDGNTVLFDGHAAIYNNNIGLWDTVSNSLKYNDGIGMTYDA